MQEAGRQVQFADRRDVTVRTMRENKNGRICARNVCKAVRYIKGSSGV
jgi:hypothetical protein